MSDFWTRRRGAVEAEGQARRTEAAQDAAAQERAALEDLPEAEQLERLGLPDPETIVSGEDVKAFMREAVPAALRTRALRRLWRTNPVLANLDGLADYNGDFTGTGLKGRAIQTTYEVGKGLAAHVKKVADDLVAERAPEGDDPDAGETRRKGLDICDDTEPAPLENGPIPSSGDVKASPDISPYAESGESGPLPRPRMSFVFGEDAESDDAEPAGSQRSVRRGPSAG